MHRSARDHRHFHGGMATGTSSCPTQKLSSVVPPSTVIPYAGRFDDETPICWFDRTILHPEYLSMRRAKRF
jgi:hypothetical protein